MKLSYEDHDTISVLRVSGELTADQADQFLTGFAAARAALPTTLDGAEA
jgi:hypothetical protein